MNVELPNGTIIEDVPDGISKAELARKLQANGMNVPEEWLSGSESGAGKVFAKRAALSALPGVGGLAGAESGAVLGAGLGTMIAPGLGTGVGGILGALAGGVGGSMLTSKAQEKLLEAMPETRAALGVDPETLAREEEDHRIAAMAGSLAGQAISMRPSITTIRQAFGKGTAKEIAQARAMVGAGVGVGGGLSAGMQQLENPGADPDWADIAEGAIAGGLFTKPTRRIGQPVSEVARRLAGEKPRIVPPVVKPDAEAPPAEESVLRPPLREGEVPPATRPTRPGAATTAADLIRGGELSPAQQRAEEAAYVSDAERAMDAAADGTQGSSYDEEGIPSWYEGATEAPPTEAPPTETPPTEAPPTEAPPTEAPPTEVAPVDPAQAAQLSEQMTGRTTEENRRRKLDRMGFPSSEEEHSPALAALKEGKYVVAEGFGKYRNLSSQTKHHVYDTEGEALKAAGEMTRKTGPEYAPKHIDIIYPTGEVTKLDRKSGGRYSLSKARISLDVEKALINTETQRIKNDTASYPEDFAKLPRGDQLQAFDLVTKDFDPENLAQRDAITEKLEELKLTDEDIDWLFTKAEELAAAGKREPALFDTSTAEEGEGAVGYQNNKDWEESTPLRSSTDSEIAARGTTPEEKPPVADPQTPKEIVDAYGRGEIPLRRMIHLLGLRDPVEEVSAVDPDTGKVTKAKVTVKGNRVLEAIRALDPLVAEDRTSVRVAAERMWKVLEPYYGPRDEVPTTPKRPTLSLKNKNTGPEPLSDTPKTKAGDRAPTHTLETVLPELKKTFGIHTERLFKNGFLNIVATHADLPENIRNSTNPSIRASYSPTANKVYIVAENIPVGYNLKGLMAHEVGVHAGMETMLGTPLFEKLLKEVADRAAKGEKPFKEAHDRVPYTTPGENVDEERLAYVISKYKNLPFVKQIYSQLRQWLWRKMGGRFITLSNDDLNAMALASLKRVSDLAETGRTGELRRDAALAARAEKYAAENDITVEEANKKLSETFNDDVKPLTDEEKTAQDQATFVRNERKKLNRSTVMGRWKNWLEETRDRPYETQVKLFQDYRRKLLTSARALRAAGRIKEDETDLHALSTATPSKLESTRTAPIAKGLTDAIQALMARTKWSDVEVLAKFNRWMHALTEPDLRKWLYTRYVPLRDAPVKLSDGRVINPAEARETIVKAYETAENLTAADARQKYGYNADDLRNYMDYLVKNFAEPNGFTPEDAPPSIQSFRPDRKITDINHSAYDLTGVSQDAIRRWRAELEKELAGEHGPAIRKVLDAEKALRDETVRLEKLNGHWGNHVDNAIAVMRRSNYYTLKGDANKYNYDSMTGTRLRGELSRVQGEMGGRIFSISDNPLTQTLADSNTALSRLDKKGFLDELYRYAQKGLLRNQENNHRVLKILDPIEVGERNSYELPENVSPDSIVLRPNDKGGYDVIQILDEDWRDAIKGVVTKQSLPMDLMASGTRFLSSQLTRFQIAFAAPNAVRDLSTNMSTLGAEYGYGTAAKLGARFFTQALKGSAFKAARVARLFALNDRATLETLASKDPFVKNLYDLMKEGGITAYNTAFSNETATLELVANLKKKGIYGASKENLYHIADIWNNMFEYMNREAAYDTLRKKFIENGGDASKVNLRAATETKGLFNPELSGIHTKSLSSWFGFFRASATGAVRQIDSIMVPLFMSSDDWIRNTYGTKYQRTKNTPLNAILTNPKELASAKAYWEVRRKNAFLMAIASLGFGMAAHQMAKAVAGKDEKGDNTVSKDNYALWTRSLRIPTTILGSDATALGKDTKFISIPWVYGAGSFAAIGAQISAMAAQDAKPMEAIRNMVGISKDSFLPVPVEDWSLFNRNPVGAVVTTAAPTLLKPVLYFALNADAFGRQIYNTKYGKYASSYEGGDYVPEDYKLLSKELYEMSNGEVDIHPQSFQFFANNYVSGIATATNAISGIGQVLTGEKDLDPKTELPIISSFMGRASDADARQFNDTQTNIQKIKTKLSTFKNTDNQKLYQNFLSKNPGAPALVRQYDLVMNRINQLNSRLNDIRASDKTPKERKERVDQLRATRSLYLKQLNDSYELYKEGS